MIAVRRHLGWSWIFLSCVTLATASLAGEADRPAAPPGLGQLLISDAQSGSPVRLNVARYHVRVVLQPPVALVQIDQSFYNPFDQQQEGQFLFNLPSGASVSRFAMYVSPTELIEGELVERKRAAEIYRSIVTRRRDPAILEQLGDNLFKMRVFPVFARDEKRILLDFTLPLESQAGQYQFRLPLLSDLMPIWDFRISGAIRAAVQPQSAGCASHAELTFQPREDGGVEFHLHQNDVQPETDLVLTFAERADRAASLRSFVAEPLAPPASAQDNRPEDDWSQRTATYFLAEIPPTADAAELPESPPADVLVLADTSSSIKDLDGVRRKVRDLVHSLRPRDRVRLMCMDVAPRALHEGWLKPADTAALKRLDQEFCLGKTDLDACLRAAVQDFPGAAGRRRRLAIYVGDGAGEAPPVSAPADKRAVPAWLEDSAATLVVLGAQRADSKTDYLRTLVDNSGGLWFDLVGDVRAAGALDRWLRGGLPSPERIADVAVEGAGAEDLFCAGAWLPGEPLYVYGRRPETGEVKLRLSLGRGRKTVARDWTFPVVRNEDDVFVGRLWAQRRLNQLGRQDPQAEDTREAIIALSQEWSLLSPHTAFLVLESEDDYPRWGLDRRVRRQYWTPVEARPDVPLPPKWLDQFQPPKRAEPSQLRQQALDDLRVTAASLPRGLLDPAAPSARAGLQPSITTLLGSAFRADPEFLRRHPCADRLLQQVDMTTLARGQTLEQFAAQLADLTGAHVILDRQALDNIGIRPDVRLDPAKPHPKSMSPARPSRDDPFADEGAGGRSPVPRSAWEGAGRISLRGGARLLLRQFGLSFVEESHRLLITTSEQAESQLTTEIYPLADLLFSDRTTSPWQLAHPYLDHQMQVRRRLESKLTRPVTIECRERPLADVVLDLASTLDDTFLIDRRALEDIGVDSQTPITASFRAVPAKQALEWILGDLGLEYTLHEEALVVTTAEVAESHLEVRLHSARGVLYEYPAETLEFSERMGPMPGWGAGGAAMGGGGFGGMGGGMGGAFGSGMGGMAGFGGGMGGTGGGGFGGSSTPPAGLGAAGLSSGGDAGTEPRASTQLPPASDPAGMPTTADLVPAADPRPLAKEQYSPDSGTLVDMITSTIAPESWSDVGGPGSIEFFPYSLDLVSAQTRDVHERLADLLDRLRRLPPQVPIKSGGRPATIRPSRLEDATWPDFDTVIELVTSTVQPQTWDDVGGPGSIEGESTRLALVVSQTSEVQDEVAKLLTMLRRGRYETLHGTRPWETSSSAGLRPAAAVISGEEATEPLRLSDYPAAERAELETLLVRCEPETGRWRWRRVEPSGASEEIALRLDGSRLECELSSYMMRTAGDTAAVAWRSLRLAELGNYAELLRRTIDGQLPWLPHRSNEELARLFHVFEMSEGDGPRDPSFEDAAWLRMVPAGLAREGGTYLQMAYSQTHGLPVAWESYVGGRRTARIRFSGRPQGARQRAWRNAVLEDARGRELARWELVEFQARAGEIPPPSDPFAGYVHLDRRAERPAIDAPLAEALTALRGFDWARAMDQLRRLPDDRVRHPLVLLLQAWCLENDRQMGPRDRLVGQLLEVAQSGAPELLRFVTAGNFPSLTGAERYAILSLQDEATRTAQDCDHLADAAVAVGNEAAALQHVTAALERGAPGAEETTRRRRHIELLLRLGREAEAVSAAGRWAGAAERSPDELASLAELLAAHAQQEPADAMFARAMMQAGVLAADDRYALLRRWAAIRRGVPRCEKLLEAAAHQPAGSPARRECVDLLRQELATAAQADAAGQLAAKTADAGLAAELVFRQAELTPSVTDAAALLWQLVESGRLAEGRLTYASRTWNAAGQPALVIEACETVLRGARRLSPAATAELATAYRAEGREGDARRASTHDPESTSPEDASARDRLPPGRSGSSGGFF